MEHGSGGGSKPTSRARTRMPVTRVRLERARFLASVTEERRRTAALQNLAEFREVFKKITLIGTVIRRFCGAQRDGQFISGGYDLLTPGYLLWNPSRGGACSRRANSSQFLGKPCGLVGRNVRAGHSRRGGTRRLSYPKRPDIQVLIVLGCRCREQNPFAGVLSGFPYSGGIL